MNFISALKHTFGKVPGHFIGNKRIGGAIVLLLYLRKY